MNGEVAFATSGNKYCGAKKAGEPCFVSKMCATQECRPNNRCRCNSDSQCPGSGVCVLNDCKQNKQIVGAACDSDQDCVNGACAHPQWNPNAQPQECCKSGKAIFSQFGFKVCSQQPDNRRCFVGAMCLSGNCENGRCRPARP